MIVGPTASGKTSLALQLAQTEQVEIISADSRQVYRYMDIGTAKPSLSERKAIHHHCIDIRNPDEFFSAGEYGKLARQIIRQTLEKNHIPVVVGGSGLYIQAAVECVFSGNYRDSRVRLRLKQKASEEGLQILYHRLSQIDPVAVEKIHPNDLKRIVRALEVYELSGEPISHIQKKKTVPSCFIPQFWGLRWPREILYRRINERVDEMMALGLIYEVEMLKARGYDTRLNSLDSVGYKEVFAYLDGTIGYTEMVESIKQNTRRLAKKQLTWFNRNQRITWIDLEEPTDWHSIAERIISKYHSAL
ncbi:tRNA (adenosine(37)-N6)-dimethylallyltransferase MiaA [bacterium]|nr:tRNA (adenosine(37)-N6)-dimethylallyltransferase MiaA [bacterium]